MAVRRECLVSPTAWQGCFLYAGWGNASETADGKSADEIPVHNHAWLTEGVCAVSQIPSATRIQHSVSKAKERGRMLHKMEDKKNGKVS